MKIIFQSPRLRMRRWRRQDLQAFHQIWGDPRVIWWRGTPQSWAQSRDTFRKVQDICEELPPELGWWCMEEVETGDLLGNLMLKPLGDGEAEIGVNIRFERWGEGFGSESVQAGADHGLNTVGLERIIAVIQSENQAGKRLVEKCGFTQSGFVMRQNFPHERYVKGEVSTPEAGP